MGSLITLATRNLTRNRRRSIITIVAIASGLALMLTSLNLGRGMYEAMIQTGVSTQAGHVVIQGEGYQAERDADIAIPDAEAIQTTVESALPGATVLRRTFLQGLLTSPANAVGVGVTAIDPAREVLVSDWQDKVVEGEFLSAEDTRQARQGIVLGVGLADTLGVEVGDKIVFMAQGPDDVASRLFRVRGLIRTGSADLDGFFALIPLAATADFMPTPGAATQISVHLPDAEDTDAATAITRAVLDGYPLEVLPWQDALPELYQFILMDRGSNNAMMAVIGFIVALGVVNTILMSVLERTREFGVMLAIGVSPSRVARLILLESALLGVVSVTIGAALGALMTWPLIEYGLDVSSALGDQMQAAGVSVSSIFRAAWDWPAMITYCSAALILSALAGAWPAWRAAHLRPVDAMRHT